MPSTLTSITIFRLFLPDLTWVVAIFLTSSFPNMVYLMEKINTTGEIGRIIFIRRFKGIFI